MSRIEFIIDEKTNQHLNKKFVSWAEKNGNNFNFSEFMRSEVIKKYLEEHP